MYVRVCACAYINAFVWYTRRDNWLFSVYASAFDIVVIAKHFAYFAQKQRSSPTELFHYSHCKSILFIRRQQRKQGQKCESIYYICTNTFTCVWQICHRHTLRFIRLAQLGLKLSWPFVQVWTGQSGFWVKRPGLRNLKKN